MYIEQLKSGSRVQIQQVADREHEGYMCKVEVAIPESKIVLVHAPISHGRMVWLPVGGTFTLRLLSDNATYRYDAVLDSYTDIDGFDVIMFKLTSGGDKIQRRSAFRFNCALPVSFAVISQSVYSIYSQFGSFLKICQ